MKDAEEIKWRAEWRVDKFHEDFALLSAEEQAACQPYEMVTGRGNLLMYGGASTIWQALIGNGTGTGDQNLTFFNNANAHLAVGDSNTAAVATHNDLQASTNKLRVAMDATYPQHTDGTTSGSATITFRGTFTSGQANYVWNEWGIFNSDTAGRMLNRRVVNLGTKASGTWQLTVTLTLS